MVMKRFVVITLSVIILCFITSCAKPKNKVEIYSFSGKNETITINNGLIIVTNDIEKFIGGDLSFNAEEPTDVQSYSGNFFFYKEGNKSSILSDSTTLQGTTEGQKIPSELGSISSKDLFYGNDLELVKDSLNFSLRGKLMNGERFEYNLILDIKKAY
jgi:hypothetical protein